MNIKATTLKYFCENRLTRDICPNVRTEDLVLCSLYRDPYQHLVSSVKVEYISTVSVTHSARLLYREEHKPTLSCDSIF